MAYAAVRGARSRPAAPARRDDGVDVASRDRVLAVAVAAGLRAVGCRGARTVPEDALRPGPGGRRGLVLVADDAGSLPGPPLLAVLRRPGPVVVVGAAVAADRLLVAARAGALVVAAERPFGDQVRTVARMLAGDVRAGDALLVEQLVGVVRDRRAVASLTGRETEVLEHLAGGRSVAEIAAALVLSVATVRAHVRSILGKLGVSSQLAASAALARARGGRPVRR
ncbi:response regulator transcription factor [Cellulosimicrobium funkei]